MSFFSSVPSFHTKEGFVPIYPILLLGMLRVWGDEEGNCRRVGQRGFLSNSTKEWRTVSNRKRQSYCYLQVTSTNRLGAACLKTTVSKPFFFPFFLSLSKEQVKINLTLEISRLMEQFQDVHISELVDLGHQTGLQTSTLRYQIKGLYQILIANNVQITLIGKVLPTATRGKTDCSKQLGGLFFTTWPGIITNNWPSTC